MERSVRDLARAERVRILLRTRNDVYPSPRSLSIPSTPSGPAPQRFIRCAFCDGTGRVRNSQVCPSCDGRRKIAIDSYTGRVSDEDDPKPEPMSPERVDAELERLSTSLRLSSGEIDPNESYGWERAVRRRDQQGSYRELEWWLERLRSADPRAWDFIHWVYSSGLNVELSSAAGVEEQRIVGALARVMPGRIRLPGRLARELQAQKEGLILSLSKQDLKEQEIADFALVSVSTVRKVLGKDRAVTKARLVATLTA